MREFSKKLKDARSILFLKKSIFNAPIKYLIVVSSVFVLDFLIYSALIELDLSIYLANTISFCIGATLNVVLIRRFVFPESRFSFFADLPLTFVVNGAMLGLGMGLLWIFVELVAVNPYWAKLVANGITFLINYIIRSLVFTKKIDADESLEVD